MDFGTWLDLREELTMLVITASNSLLLSLMSQFGIGSSMHLFAGDLQIIFHTSASVAFRRTVRVETGGDCAISRLISEQSGYCRTHNVSVCLYIAYIACGSALLYINTLYFFLTVLALSAAATVANIKIRYDAKIPQFAIFGTHVIYVFYSIPNFINLFLEKA